MRGHIRQRGKSWSYTIDLGDQKAQRCSECRKRFWIERKPLESCPKCGSPLTERVERRQREQGGFKTRKEAQSALTSVLGNLQTGSYIAPAKITVRDYLIDEWLPAVKATVRPSTLASYQMHVGRHIAPALGNLPLQKLSGATINAFYAKLLSEPRQSVEQPRRNRGMNADAEPKPPLSPATVRRVHATLRKALGDAVRWNRIPRNPALAADPPKQKVTRSREMQTWTAQQLSAFLTCTRETRFYPLWLTLATTGMRRGEALGLRWEDADLDKARLSIQQNRTTVGYEVSTGQPKSGHGRNVSLDPATVAALRTLRVEQKKEQLRWPGYVKSGYLFVQENGEPYHPNRITKIFKEAVKASKQSPIRLHDLRHTHATLALGAGVHPKVVSERLGHASILITLDIYSHAVPALEEEAAAKVAAMFVPI